MKNILTLLAVSLLLLSCGNEKDSVEDIIENGNLGEMRAKKTELVQEQSKLKASIDSLTAAIEAKDTTKKAALVTTTTLQDTLFQHYFEVQGNVETDQNIVLYPEYTGVLTQVYVKEGQRVAKGQRLARIDDGGLGSELARQEAQLALAKTTFERQKRLWDQKIGSEISYLEAKTNYEAMEAATNQMRSRIGKTVITAPFSGVIDNLIADQGQVVNAGQTPVIRLINLSDMYVNASIPEAYLGKVNEGTDVKIRLASIGKTYDGKIRQVGNFVNPDNRTFDVKVALPNADSAIKPNLIATVMVNDYTSENAIVIPENTIQQNAAGNSITYIYVNDGDGAIAKQVQIEKGYSSDKQVEVLSGLKSGDQLIIEGVRTLRDGQQVTLENQNSNNQ
ncbi:MULTISPECIES: efflux RND transporter periplasmic adaptor subunit [unclassified Leeuwenhoekiella]|uniref:efflux RND transporter periplasmic adaptor subunit n=1 Tax=unclassified Leeuwenhoekiella TaxID=2615029 RepID=UPI000C5D2077|nr:MULTISPECIES: efflux RND transporter periplasmic adaptor subunit [unclassified Leeuwenhoekiella]MAS71561.1 efflux transporter periplasmic adaptor subunit [Zunongwangia sp.]MAW96300.1 efflux transporter periplasmic adaptor subunit [Leeuwenhoekiella sp.]MBA82791.1 efflux transporter periplasmic adaptor subunit [Leeuwenhoekiella sp.]|tara:strand:- start:3625 stop:4800 length:1176 start_codon:yes stop_codon:yes gene_type:complete